VVALLAEGGGRAAPARPEPRSRRCASAGWRGSPTSSRSGSGPTSVQSARRTLPSSTYRFQRTISPDGTASFDVCVESSLLQRSHRPARQRDGDKADEHDEGHPRDRPGEPVVRACSKPTSGACSDPLVQVQATGRPSPRCRTGTRTRRRRRHHVVVDARWANYTGPEPTNPPPPPSGAQMEDDEQARITPSRHGRAA